MLTVHGGKELLQYTMTGVAGVGMGCMPVKGQVVRHGPEGWMSGMPIVQCWIAASGKAVGVEAVGLGGSRQ